MITTFYGNYAGPLYAPHPDLIKQKEEKKLPKVTNTEAPKVYP